jgi:hypothetical protein
MDKFTITEQHLKLLQHAYVGWDDCEFGAPEIDCKRPYGNSDVLGDMADILYGKLPADAKEKVVESTQDFLYKLHKDLEMVLQICLVTQKFEAGTYEPTGTYDARGWKKISD